jgi:hypothetical protein
MLDVIAQNSASLDFAFVSTKWGPVVIEDPLRSRSRGTTAWRSRGQPLAQLPARRDLLLRERSPRPGEGAEDSLSPTRLCRRLQRTMNCGVANGGRKEQARRATTSMRRVMKDRAEMPNGNRL